MALKSGADLLTEEDDSLEDDQKAGDDSPEYSSRLMGDCAAPTHDIINKHHKMTRTRVLTRYNHNRA